MIKKFHQISWQQAHRSSGNTELSLSVRYSRTCHSEALGDLAAFTRRAALFVSCPSKVPFIENDISLIEFAREKVT